MINKIILFTPTLLMLLAMYLYIRNDLKINKNRPKKSKPKYLKNK